MYERTNGTDVSDGAPVDAVVQHRLRLLRAGISELLMATDDIKVVGEASTGSELLGTCRRHRPAVVIMEAEAVEWDLMRLVAALRGAHPGLVAVGLTLSTATSAEMAQARHAGVAALVPRDAGLDGILDAVRAPQRGSGIHHRHYVSRSAAPSAPRILTARELEILNLVAAGLTSVGVSGRLNISHKTVENHKQRIFAKLGVHNQAHAVSAAIRSGAMSTQRG